MPLHDPAGDLPAVLELITPRERSGTDAARGLVQDDVMIRPPSVLIVAAVLGSFAVACGAPSSRAAPSTPPPSVAVSTSTFGPIAPPPAEVLDATVVYFDPDGTDRQRDLRHRG